MNRLVLAIIIFTNFYIHSQILNCNTLEQSFRPFNDSTLDRILNENKEKRVLLIGEDEWLKNAPIENQLIEISVLKGGYSTILTEQPISCTYLYKQFLESAKFDEARANSILTYIANKKDFKKTLKKLHALNKIKPI